MSEKPAGLQAVDELQSEVTSAEDLATLQAWQAEIEAERQGIDHAPVDLRELPDGTVVTQEEHQQMIDENQDPSGPYDGHGRA